MNVGENVSKNFQVLIVTNGETFDIESSFFQKPSVEITWCDYKQLSSYIKNRLFHTVIFSSQVEVNVIHDTVNTVQALYKECLYVALVAQEGLGQVELYLESGIDSIVLFPLKKNGLERVLSKHYTLFESQNEMNRVKHSLQTYEYAIDQSFIFAKTDLAGDIKEVNDAFCMVTGYEKDEIIGSNFSLLHHPDTLKEKIQELWTTIQRKKVYRNRIYNRTKLDDDIIFDMVIVPVLDYEEEIQEYICFMQDVTDVVSMNAFLRNEQSMHEKKLNEVKDSYLQIFSHELKTPLNAIINFSQYVEKKVGNCDIQNKDKLLQPLQNIRQCGYEISDMIHSLITLTKLRDKKIDLHLTQISLEDTISLVLQKFELIIKQECVDVEVITNSNSLVQTDEMLIMTVLGAVISNAIKYGNKKIRITLAVDTTSFMVSIEDNGPGIEDKKNAFELFEQGDRDTMTRTGKGAGIGLHLCNVIANMLELDLDIETSDALHGANVIIVGKSTHSKGQQ